MRKKLLVKEANGTDGVEGRVNEVACGNKDWKTVVNREELERIRSRGRNCLGQWELRGS